MAAFFTPALFAFFRDLKSHNTREWFEQHRERYVADVEAPMQRFITALAPEMALISRAIVVSPARVGGSIYRIHRDTRFSPDKTPYKTHIAAHFRHKAKKTVPSVPGFYLHLEPGECLGGGGIYHPDSPTLTRIRLAIVDNGRAWGQVKAAGLAIEGDRLKRAPVGFDPAHKYAEDLKQKDFYALSVFTQKDVCSADFVDRYVEACRTVAPLVAFVAKAMQLPW